MTKAAATKHVAVTSSNIFSIGYDPARYVMQVTFHETGVPVSTYEYTCVFPEEHEAFLNAESKGQHFAKKIRGRFEGTKLNMIVVPEPETSSGSESLGVI